jgi:hypothetical protein
MVGHSIFGAPLYIKQRRFSIKMRLIHFREMTVAAGLAIQGDRGKDARQSAIINQPGR